MKCALILSRVALQIFAEQDPTRVPAIASALNSEIEGTRLEQSDGADAVAGIIAEFRDSLSRVSDRVWYLEE